MKEPLDAKAPRLEEKWPRSGPDFNQWFEDISLFAAIVKKGSGMWIKDGQLKYLDVRIDTRSGHFVLFDRDHKRITPERVLLAAAQAEAAGLNEVYPDSRMRQSLQANEVSGSNT